MIPVLVGITFIIFFIISLSTGDPATIILGQDASEEQLAAWRVEMGIDKPVFIQYINYMIKVFTGNFGVSWMSGKSVLDEILLRIPKTLLLGVLATLFSICIGIPLGILSAIRQYRLLDYTCMALAMLLFSIPAFWLGIMCQVLFCLVLNWLPAAGADSFKYFILPTIVLGSSTMGSMIRMSRTSMLDVIRQDFVRTARAKGIRENRVILHHALRNGLIPVVTQIGLTFAACVGGATVTEVIFTIPGIGSSLIYAVRSRDTPVVMGMVIFISAAVGIINLIVDIICARIDPRIDLAS